jgi:hypothetical protein
MTPNIKEIGSVITQMQVLGMSQTGLSMNAPKFNQAAADIVKQGIQQKQDQRRFGIPTDNSNNKLL